PVSKEFPTGQDVFVFRKKTIPDAALTQRLVEETAKQICTALVSLNEPESAYCLMLVLFEAFGRDDWFPPVLTLGLDSDRKRHANDPVRYWDSQHFKYSYIALTGPVLADYTQQFIQECELKHMYALPRIALKRIAKELRQMEVEKLIPVTEDFVIVPFDCDTPSIEASLQGVYSPSEIKRLAAKGLLLDEPA
ncbi:MAG: hypothetical protein ICV83_34415, partial [Cytophagales bacterium]|nr:hypothetical protein [Cytophagales bacterium]